MIEDDKRYMRRALQIARGGLLHASPNPMVGAVIVAPGGRIIGEGFHRRCGEGHAEPNAIVSVDPEDRPLLRQSTIYVTLEPCSHHGRTPACSNLIIKTGIPRVVVGCLDPFAKVNGRGIKMLRDAGVDVTVGILENECRDLNRKFIRCHRLNRPFITLKWAQTADGFMDARDDIQQSPLTISTPLTSVAVHRLRATHDAIMVGEGTVSKDNPSLSVRLFAGDTPTPVILGSDISPGAKLLHNHDTIIISTTPPSAGMTCRHIECDPHDITAVMSKLYDAGISSLLVEGGHKVLSSFINAGLWDVCRIEISSDKAPTAAHRQQAPSIPPGTLTSARLDSSVIMTITR